MLKEYIIAPPGRSVRINTSELWRYRDLFLVLAWRDISVRYKQTILGVLWAILQPTLTMIIFTVIFNRMAGIESGDGTPYPIFLFSGQLLWLYFSNTVTHASNSLVVNAQMIKKIYFPRLILPTTAATTSFVDFLISLTILAGMMVWYGYMPNINGIMVFIVSVFNTIICALGIGYFMSAINIKYRDVRHALPFLIQTIMYLTPVIYPVSMLDNHPLAKNLMIWLNPMTGIIQNARASLLGNMEVDYLLMCISLGVSVVYLFVGLRYFKKTERYFADVA